MGSKLLATLLISGVLTAVANLTPQLADAFEKKVQLVQKNADEGPKPLSTSFTEPETNSYLKFKAGSLLPTGLTEPVLTMEGEGRVSGTAVVDLDVVRQKQSSGGWLDPTSYLAGKLPVAAAGKVVTADGKGRFELERAEISGLPLPKSLLEQLVRFFTRTADNPKGSSVDDTFDLPAGIRRIDVDKGKFTVHQ